MKAKYVLGLTLIYLITCAVVSTAFLPKVIASASTKPTTYSVRIDTNIPATDIGYSDMFGDKIVLHPLGILNTPTSMIWDNVLGGALVIPLEAKGARDVLFSDSTWINHNGKASLSSILTLKADPITTTQIVAIIIGTALVLSAVILAIQGVSTYGVLLIGALALTGGIIIVTAAVDIVGSSIGDITVLLIIVVTIFGLIFLLPGLADRYLPKKKSQK